MTQQPTQTIALVAGEASGDLLGSHLITAIRAIRPDVKFIGIGGPKMKSAGMDEILFPMEKLSVNGYLEVLKHLPELIGIRRKLRRHLLNAQPDLFIGIDAPDFNFGLELALKKHGIPVVHYASPSIWAWRGERIKKIKRAVSHMLVLFPFEEAIYQKANIPVTYVGHMLADELPLNPDRAAMREQMNLLPHERVFAMLPGSRQGEVRRLADICIETAQLMLKQIPNARFLVPLVTRETRTIFEAALWKYQAYNLPITLLFGHAQDALTAAEGALVASGTATLEAALLKCPMVVTYKIAPLTYRMAKHKMYLPYYSLPNVLAGRFVVPEILQDDATPENLAQALLNLVSNQQAVNEFERMSTDLHQQLRQDTAHKAAQAILPYLDS
jgi:lipid-A-disaccharide synthase